MPDGQPTGQIDLEKELACSICTDVLYQPLTLLDCLHTFCGACLKEWFLSQASRASSIHPYTCPACRASVRGTKHNATVSTLLDMFLQANPGKVRPEEERKEADRMYKPGDNVLPKLRRKHRHRSDEADQRDLNAVMALSLEEAGITNAPAREEGGRLRPERSRERRTSDGTSLRAEPRQVGMYIHTNDSRHRGRVSPRVEAAQITPDRTVEHQSSLRSLLSVSEHDVEEEIMRHIVEDGILNGIDMNNLTPEQEDELSERIAAAYRQRREEQRRERRQRERSAQGARERSSRQSTQRSRQGSRQSSRQRPESRTQGPPSPRRVQPSSETPHAMTSTEVTATHLAAPSRHRATSRHRSSSAGDSTNQEPDDRPAARSLSTQPPRTEERATVEAVELPADSRPAGTLRRTTDPVTRLVTDPIATSPTTPNAVELPAIPIRSESEGPTIATAPTQISPRLNAGTFPLDRQTIRRTEIDSPSSRAMVDSPINQASSPIFTEPSISCNRCKRAHIEYEIHYVCTKCDSSGYSLCQRCYRKGEGCLHWFGFGWAAMEKYERQKPATGYPQAEGFPHVLTANRYLRLTEAPPSTTSGALSLRDPKSRLQSGVFCDMCSAFANDWYWLCDLCNEGEWGFCNACVNQGRHCTHPLLSLHYSPLSLTSPPTSPPQSPGLDQSSGPASLLIPHSNNTECDICKYPISPSNTRFHCPTCNGGNYDMHTNCYSSLVKSGHLPLSHGPARWRRCLQGHRMVVLGFEDRAGGQKRIVVRDLVGGNALREDEVMWSWTDHDGTVHRHTNAPSNAEALERMPPDGGVGLRLVSYWGYFPADGVGDELMFPKGAEIKEAEDINGDWLWGVYAGASGLFPGNYGRVVKRVE
ncbi:hypothetical protein BT63DRAFT_408372 [Microthyrium microscopicum]|uniref:RING-type domain-containing protein n=1 Tax=Microthyrium microscopicum TaxID=703497 RepID=A0A6A6URR5_9PEZI|nr:hypothetical protein BT63DRAFT_408372 [Microthyrium microscopicum]